MSPAVESDERSGVEDGRPRQGRSPRGRTALRAAAVAAATTAGAAAARQALTKQGGGALSRLVSNELLGAGMVAAWHAAREHVVPVVEEGAGALGRYLGSEGPEFFRNVLVPRFVRAFEDARAGRAD